MGELTRLTRSAIVVVVPEVESTVGRWREELDPSAELGVPAHITLLYPFARPADVTDATVARAAGALQGIGAFDYRLGEVRWFDDTTVWLAPDPVEPFVELIERLAAAFPEFPRYGGEFDDIVPHLTLGDKAPHERMLDAARTVSVDLPIHARASEVTLLVGGNRPGSWRVEHELLLA